MDWELVAQVAIAGLPLATALAGARRRTDPLRRQMMVDAQILAALPAGSQAHTALLDVLGRGAKTLRERQSYTRDKGVLALAITGSLLLGYAGLWLVLEGTWWSWLLAIPIGALWIVFFFGIFDSAQLRDQEAHKREQVRKKELAAQAKKSKRDKT